MCPVEPRNAIGIDALDVRVRIHTIQKHSRPRGQQWLAVGSRAGDHAQIIFSHLQIVEMRRNLQLERECGTMVEERLEVCRGIMIL